MAERWIKIIGDEQRFAIEVSGEMMPWEALGLILAAEVQVRIDFAGQLKPQAVRTVTDSDHLDND